MTICYIDIETYSPVDIINGVDVYAEHEDFRVLMAAYTVDDEPVHLTLDPVRDARLNHLLTDASITKVAHNARFERVCLSRLFDYPMPAEQWYDTAALAALYGLNRSLAASAYALGTTEKKDPAGKALIKLFSIPQKRLTKAQVKAGWKNDVTADKSWWPEDLWSQWREYQDYCVQDVYTLRDVHQALEALGGWPATERDAWAVSERINDRGILIDMQMVEGACNADEVNREKALGRIKEITGADNPNSRNQVLAWLYENGYDTDCGLTKAEVADQFNRVAPIAREVLELREITAAAAVKKFHRAKGVVSADGRARGGFKFAGSHTGRYSGSGVQLQNLPREHTEDPQAIEDLREGYVVDAETLKGLVRGMFLGPFTVADYSSIEARVLAWLAGEDWALDAFRNNEDIYLAMAERLGGLDRQQGKAAVLGLGYAGGVKALMNTGYQGTEDEALELRDLYRKANQNIVQFWYDLEDAVRRGSGVAGKYITVSHQGRSCIVTLPSGRQLWYRGMQFYENKRGPEYPNEMTYVNERGQQTSLYTGVLCLARDTLVVTARGDVPITEVTQDDLVWDGVEWCSTGGCVEKGTKDTLEVDGVGMTPDHQVLTTEGWRNGETCEGLERYSGREPGSTTPRTRPGERAAPMGDDLRLRGEHRTRLQRPVESASKVTRRASRWLRVPPGSQQSSSRRGGNSDLESVVQYAAAVQPGDTRGLRKLRGTRDNGGTRVESIRELPTGHGSNLEEGIDPRARGQQPRVFREQLPLGDILRTSTESENYPLGRNTRRVDDSSRCEQVVGGEANYPRLSVEPRGSRDGLVQTGGRPEPVYDLIDCGPRSRFTVVGETGPLVVHNCNNVTQAIARDLLVHGLINLDRANYRTVAHVHDEVVVEGEDLEGVLECITDTPEWATDLPVTADGFTCERYRKG